MQRQLETRVQIESLHNGRRNDGITADVVHKLHRVFHRLLAADAFGRTAERKVDRKLFEKSQNAGPPVDADARQLPDANARVRERAHLRAREKIEAVLVVIFIHKDLRRLFRRDGLLNVVGEHLPEREVRSDIHIGNGDEAVFEIVHTVDVKTRAALIGMSVVGRWSKHSIFDRVETDV
jgi:hypothetical protein